jgi:NADP-reducing hydrogenase subunit HndB
MPKLKNLQELEQLRERVQSEMKARTQASTTITIGMGTCGISAGAREVMHAIILELDAQSIDAHVTTTGCIGMCSKEPLVDIQQGDEPRVTYGNVTPAMVPQLIDEHLVQGKVVADWVVGRVAGQEGA